MTISVAPQFDGLLKAVTELYEFISEWKDYHLSESIDFKDSEFKRLIEKAEIKIGECKKAFYRSAIQREKSWYTYVRNRLVGYPHLEKATGASGRSGENVLSIVIAIVNVSTFEMTNKDKRNINFIIDGTEDLIRMYEKIVEKKYPDLMLSNSEKKKLKDNLKVLEVPLMSKKEIDEALNNIYQEETEVK